MSRRAIGGLVAGLVVAGLVPFVTGAFAASCPSFTDPAGDDSFAESGVVGHDDDLDIVNVTYSSDAERVSGAIKVAKLKTGPDNFPGDRFAVTFKVNGKTIQMFSYRYDPPEQHLVIDQAYNTTGGTVDGANPSPAFSTIETKYDVTASVVTISVKRSELDRVSGAATAGKPLSALGATSAAAVARTNFLSDTATAPATLTYDVGTACTGGTPGPAPTTSASPTASPTASPSPSATPSPTASPSPSGTPSPTPSPTGTTPAPAGLPAAGCNTVADPKGDAKHLPAGIPEPDLDITGLVMQATATDLKSYLRLDKLGTSPDTALGHTFYTLFTVNKKVVSLAASGFDPAVLGDVADDAASASGGALQPTVRMVVAGTYVPSGIKATFDVTNSMVVISVPRADVAKAVGVPFTDGTELTALYGRTASSYGPVVGGFYVDSSAPDNGTVSTAKWSTGANECFGPLPGKLVNAGATSVQFTDAATVGAKLTTAAGAPLSGRTVTFTVGSKTVSAKTASNGIAKAALNPGLVAGAYTLVTSFAGDSLAAKVSTSTPFTVAVEKTKLVLTVAKSGTKRTVTARLLDDDNKPVAGQTVNWYVNGKKVASAKTNAAGVVTFTRAAPTQTVTAEFLAVAKRFAGSKTSIRV